MVPDAELISLLSTVLSRTHVGEYTIKVQLYVFEVASYNIAHTRAH